MALTFREALLAALSRTGVSLSKVAREAGVSYDQLKKLKQRDTASTNVDDARRIANFFGVTLDEFLEDRTVGDRVRVVEIYNQLSPRERQILRAAGEADPDPDPPERQ